MSDNITEIPNIERNNSVAQLEQFKRNLPALLELAEYIAKVRYANYTQLIKAGFTPEQALVLCK
jgi:hypothetical protein